MPACLPRTLPLISFVGLLLAPVASQAEEGLAFSLDLPPQAIYGGTEVATCGWPTTVSMQGQCTGTLVHPEVVIYAAHCGGGYSSVRFGETIQGGGGRTVSTEFCRTYPGGSPGSGTDMAFCKLAEPVTDVEIVPILMGCETSILQQGTEVVIVGFGNANNGPYGIKREVTTTINAITGQGEAFIGGGGKDSCQGDSGGPVYVKLDNGAFGDPADDTWRVFGITSYGGACGQGGYYSMMHNGIQWFESESGIDLTPCHDDDGEWAPTGECGFFPKDPATGGGTWAEGCAAGPVGGLSQLCGAAAAPDETPPTAVIIDPIDGTEYPGPNQAMVVVVDAQDEGWGIREVQLIINGEEIEGGVDSNPPYEFEVTMPTGQWWFGAKAIDHADNVAYAAPVGVGVGEPAPIPEEETTGGETETEGAGGGTSDSEGGTGGDETGGTGESESGGGGSSASGGDPSGDDSSATGGSDSYEVTCECSSGGGGGGGAALFGFFVLLTAGQRRRRRA